MMKLPSLVEHLIWRKRSSKINALKFTFSQFPVSYLFIARKGQPPNGGNGQGTPLPGFINNEQNKCMYDVGHMAKDITPNTLAQKLERGCKGQTLSVQNDVREWHIQK